MDALRKPFFIAACVLIVLTVLVELGSGLALRAKAASTANLLTQAGKVSGMAEHMDKIDPSTLGDLQQRKPPGVGIPFLAFLDGLIVFSVGLMGAQFVLGERLQGRLQGILSLIVSILVLLAVITLIFLTLAKVLLMIGLFLSVPFGTLAYLAVWGFFNTGAAKAALGLLLALKLAFAVCLVLAHQRFLQNKGLVLILLTSLLANLIVSFLHALVPSILVSITDGIAGIIVLILAAIWAICLLVGAVISVIKAIA
jgi:hypothetical protein